MDHESTSFINNHPPKYTDVFQITSSRGFPSSDQTLSTQQDEQSTLLNRNAPSNTIPTHKYSSLVIISSITTTARLLFKSPWTLLLAALLAVSSAGPVFSSLHVPGGQILLSAWRLQLGGFFLLLLATWQFYYHYQPEDEEEEDRHHFHTLLFSSIPLLLLSGSLLAIHFGFWVWSLTHTSLTHSLLFVSMTPVLLALCMRVLRHPISRGEIIGTLLGMGGTVILTVGAQSEQQVTILGDAAALVASLAFVGYLMIGQKLRVFIPVFIYAAAVTCTAAFINSIIAIWAGNNVTLLLSSLSSSSTNSSSTISGHQLFGWMTSSEYFFKILYLALFPGIIGHTGINALLKVMSPLLITLALNMEPVLGSLLAYTAGLAPIPSIWTVLGGGVIMVSTLVVSVASHYRLEEEEEKRGKGGEREKGGEGEGNNMLQAA